MGLNWQDRINRAMLNGGFTDEDRSLAKEWETDAVGESAPTASYESPKFFGIGLEFLQAVHVDDTDNAQRMLCEARDAAKQLAIDLAEEYTGSKFGYSSMVNGNRHTIVHDLDGTWYVRHFVAPEGVTYDSAAEFIRWVMPRVNEKRGKKIGVA